MITNDNYVNEAEKVIKTLKERKNAKGNFIPVVTTSKIRNLLAMTSDIYNEVMNISGENLDEDICSRIEYLRIRFIYEAGREKAVKDLVETAKLLDVLASIKGSRKRYILFNRYMEALVAFRKYYCDKDE